MFKFNILLIGLITFLKLPLNSLAAMSFPSSACPNIFHYQYDETLAQWFGIILIRSPPPLGHPMELILFLSIKSSEKIDYLGAIELMESRAESIENIRRGHPVRYRVSFPMLPTLPKVNRIILNNWMICTGQLGDLGFYVTEIRLEHVLYTQLASHQTTSYPIEFVDEDDEEDQPKPTMSPKSKNTKYDVNRLESNIEFNDDEPIATNKNKTKSNAVVQKTDMPPLSSSSAADNNSQAWYVSEVSEEQMVCGRPVLKMSHFVVDERHLSHGSWPWSVALFTREQFTGQPSDYICGGTLVSTKVIVTAAHCMQRNNRKRYSNEVVAYFGRNRQEGGSAVQQQIEDIDTIIMHPDYKKFGQTFDADIALIIVRSRIRYGKLIRPICLWPNKDEFEVISGTLNSDSTDVAAAAAAGTAAKDKEPIKKSTEIDGIVVVLGRDGKEYPIASKARIINVKLVSDSECLQKNSMYNDIISNRTFCAQGSLNGRAPCFGDSGSGMAVKQMNNRWYLRGIVSGGLSDPTCMASNYVVFTDATKFIDFITPYMLL